MPRYGPEYRQVSNVVQNRTRTTGTFHGPGRPPSDTPTLPKAAGASLQQIGSGAYSAKLLNGTKQRCSGLSQARQCGDDVFLMFVTGKPPELDGGGIPQRIVANYTCPRDSQKVVDRRRNLPRRVAF